jgi:hypothetical protein
LYSIRYSLSISFQPPDEFIRALSGEVASAATKLKLWRFNEEAAALFGRCIIRAYEFDSKGEQFYCEGR